MGEGGLRPVECGDVEFVDWFATRCGEAAEQTTVEGGFEGEDREFGRARGLVVHGGGDLFCCEIDIGTASLLTALPHERSFVGKLVGVGASLGREDLIQTLRRNFEYTGLEDRSPVV